MLRFTRRLLGRLGLALGAVATVVLSGCGGSPTEPYDPGTTVSVVVFYDQNRNGVLDQDEVVRIPGVEVEIDSQTGRSQVGTGAATIPAVRAGRHEVTVVTTTLPPFFMATIEVAVVAPQPAGTVVEFPLILPIGSNTPNLYMASGDSISEGFGSTDETGYRGRLEDRLRAHWGAGEVPYRGPGGGRSNEGAERIGDDLEEVRPAYALIMWGTNDWYDDRCHPAESCYTVPSLRQMVWAAKARSTLPCVATIPPVNVGFDWRVPPERDVWVATINQAIRTMAQEEQALLVDVHAAMVAEPNRAALFTDHVHPNDAGYEVIAKTFFEALTSARGAGTALVVQPIVRLLAPPLTPGGSAIKPIVGESVPGATRQLRPSLATAHRDSLRIDRSVDVSSQESNHTPEALARSIRTPRVIGHALSLGQRRFEHPEHLARKPLRIESQTPVQAERFAEEAPPDFFLSNRDIGDT